MKVQSVYFDDEILKLATELHWKERTSLSKIVNNALKEYAEKHMDGNPCYTLEHFQDPNFKACPAFFRDRDTWLSYLNSLDEIQFKEFDTQLNILLNLGNKRFDKF